MYYGPEFVSRAMLRWVMEAKIDTVFIDPGKLWQNGSKRDVQGLGLDWACVCWDANLRHNMAGWENWRLAGISSSRPTLIPRVKLYAVLLKIERTSDVAMASNPWNRDRFLQYVGQYESAAVEFKSSRPLCLGDSALTKYIGELASHVGAFLNGDGGLLLIGLEEDERREEPDRATALSVGVPRKTLSASRLESMLCDRIHPSVAGLVKVHVVPVGTDENGGDLLAYAVEIRAGVTAYQSPDFKYYVRRGYSSVPMEDKDIRLRMLSAQVARVRLAAALDTQKLSERLDIGPLDRAEITRVGIMLTVGNVGIKTIREFDLQVRLIPQTPNTDERRRAGLAEWSAQKSGMHWPIPDSETAPLYPDAAVEIRAADVDICGAWDPSGVSLNAQFTCFLDDAPSASLSVDLSESYREAINSIRTRVAKWEAIVREAREFEAKHGGARRDADE